MERPRPDAVRIPKSAEKGVGGNDRKASIVAIAEALLECGPIELAYCHDQACYTGPWYFCSRDPCDSEKFPDWHPRAGQFRYLWLSGPDGTQLGYMIG